MAQGDVVVFNDAIATIRDGAWDLDSDTWALGIVNSTPAATDAAPHWGGTGTTDLSADQIATATSYTGPVTLTTSASTSTGTFNLTFTDVTVAQDAGGATNCMAFVVYNATDTSKRALCYGVLSEATGLDLTADPIVIDFPADYVVRVAKA